MDISRRDLLAASALAALGPGRLLAAKKFAGLKIGVTDWNLRKSGDVSALALAKQLGFEGVEVSLGRKTSGDKLALDNPEIQAQYLAQAKEQRIALSGTCLDILHVNFLKSDKLGQKWVADGIQITKKLKTDVMLLPFFGKGALQTQQEKDYIGDVLKELAPAAERAGVSLGLENTISAEDNARIMERSRSKAVKVYYDVGNSFNAGFDPVKELRWLGKDRICQIHLKDRGYIGEGKIDFVQVMQAIADIRFRGFADLETSAPSGSVEADMRKNLKYVRDVMEKVEKS